MKYEAIEANSSEFDVKKMCQVLELKEPNYYRWKKQMERSKQKIEQELDDIKKTETIFLQSDKIFGYSMIAKELEKNGHYMS